MKRGWCLAVVAFAAWVCHAGVSFEMPVMTYVEDERTGSFLRIRFSFERVNEAEPLRAAVSDDTPGGSGEAIRSSLWMSACTAGLLALDTLDGVTLTVGFSGDIDGPSAGGIMCLSVLAALENKEIPPDFAMTGAILPDGSLAAVGGVREKVKAAAQAGITRICIPASLRLVTDEDGALVDLSGLGRELNVAVHPVRTIGEAYKVAFGTPCPQLLTEEDPGTDLPRVRELEEPLAELVAARMKELDDLGERHRKRCREPDFKAACDRLLSEPELRDDLLSRHAWTARSTGLLFAAFDEANILINRREALMSFVDDWRALARRHPVLARVPLSDEEAKTFSIGTSEERRKPLGEADLKALTAARLEICNRLFASFKEVVADDPGTGQYVPDTEDAGRIAAMFEDADVAYAVMGLLAGLLEEAGSEGMFADEPDDLTRVSKEADVIRALVGLAVTCRLCEVHVRKDSRAPLRAIVGKAYPRTGALAYRPARDRVLRCENFVYTFIRAADAYFEADADEDQKLLADGDDMNLLVLCQVARMLEVHMRLRKSQVKADHPAYDAIAVLFQETGVLSSLLVRGTTYDGDVVDPGVQVEDAPPKLVSVANPIALKELLRRARARALAAIRLCQEEGYPCPAARCAFETAEMAGSEDVNRQLSVALASYWEAHLDACMTLMSFKGGLERLTLRKVLNRKRIEAEAAAKDGAGK